MKKDNENSIWEYLEKFSKTIYENEERREQHLIEQAGRMQAVFSFVIIALFTIIPTIISYCKTLPIKFLVFTFSTISFFLLLSLVFATMAQNRKKRHDFPSVSAIIKEVTQNQTYYDTTEKQQKYLVETYEKMHTSYERNNNMRSAFVKVSMCCFYISIALCLFWFLTAIYIIL